MASHLFRKSTQGEVVQTNKYSALGFTRNPFPSKPSVTFGSPNPVENGSIYLEELRENAQQRFEELLIPNPTKPQTKNIAFLMDYATRRGRGIGKTAFLWHQAKRIMSDFGDELSDHSQVIFAVYVLPSSTNTRKFWQFSKLIFQSLVEQKVIAIAIWRLRAFSNEIDQSILDQVGDEPEITIGNDQWLQNKGVDVLMTLAHTIRRQLKDLVIDDELINALVKFGHSPDDFNKYYVDKISDHVWRNTDGLILFNDIIKLLTLAGFTKGLLLCDEMERIIQAQNPKERREFTEAIRYFFIDGMCESARLSFYNLLLTLHPYSQELLNPHWEATGLDRFSVLGSELAEEYTVYFHPLDEGMAIPLAKAYLEAAMIPNTEFSELHPFDENALIEALMETGRVPGKFLTLLNMAVERAIQNNWETIDADQIKSIKTSRKPKEAGEHDSIDPLPAPDVSLLGEESE